MQRHTLTPTHSNRDRKRVGRGGKRGKTSGRGHKGQNARAGTSGRPAERDMLKKLPKLRGHGVNRARTVNPDREKPQTVTLARLSSTFAAKAEVTPKSLLSHGLVRRFNGRAPQVKIVATGELTHPVVVKRCQVSAGAREKITAAGGTIA